MPNPSGSNGYLRMPPDDLIRNRVTTLVADGYKNKEIVQLIYEDKLFDTTRFRLTEDGLKKKRSQWKLYSARGQKNTFESIAGPLEELRKKYPNVGYHRMREYIREHTDGKVQPSIPLIQEYMQEYHPQDIRDRRANRINRAKFWCVGVNDLWCMDQHDKWRSKELYLVLGMEPWSGSSLWIKIWWTNRNPKIQCSEYLNAVERRGRIVPLLTQSDPGTENNGIANAQTWIRHSMDPTLAQTLQHRFMGGKRNIKPEIHWRLLRQLWSRGFSKILDEGFDQGIYNPADILERLVFQFVFIPWLQRELDIYVKWHNKITPRADKRRAIPVDKPNKVYYYPQLFGTLDFAIQNVDQELIDEARQRYANPDDPVFELVPPRFEMLALQHYGEQGMPLVDGDNAWDIYLDLLAYFREIDTTQDVQLTTEMDQRAAMPPVGEDQDGAEHMPLLDMPRCPVGNYQIVNGAEQVVNERKIMVGGQLMFEAEEEGQIPSAEFTDSEPDTESE